MNFTGPSLRDGMTRQFSEAETTRALMLQLLRAAKTMRGAGLTHGDITPENILVGPGGCGGELHFRDSARPGTPTPARACYRSPEQLVGLGWYGGLAVDMHVAAGVRVRHGRALHRGAPVRRGVLVEGGVARRDHGHAMRSPQEGGPCVRGYGGVPGHAGDDVGGRARGNFEIEHRPTAADVLHHRWFADEGG
ncbi:unnamed protein product [Urochloa decumbens]|uniref:Non-specific serine/threonine protein kinase n=1 Tax=Urochloa decumbens TaxID=240449 RepID=A0ABC9DG01_9POAL